MTLHDLTILEFIVVALHTITAGSYLALGIHIIKQRKYLQWNRHIYPITMYGSLVLSISLFWLLTSNYFYDIKTDIAFMMIAIFLGMMAIGYSVAAEAIRLAHKFDKIEEQQKRINHLEEAIKRHKVVLLIGSLFLIVGCGGLKKEISRITEESKTKTEQYEKQITDLNSKIKETEQRETETKTDLQKKETEISTLKKQRDELQETIDKAEKSDFTVFNPVGPVKVTDAKGNKYEFEGGAGTEISNKTESLLKSTLKRVAESLNETTEKVKTLTQSIFARDKTIKEKEAEIKLQAELIEKQKAKEYKLNESLQKEVTRTSTPWYLLIGAGMFLMVLMQLAWKFGKGYLKTYLPFIK